MTGGGAGRRTPPGPPPQATGLGNLKRAIAAPLDAPPIPLNKAQPRYARPSIPPRPGA